MMSRSRFTRAEGERTVSFQPDAAGRFSAFIPGWGRMTSPVLLKVDGTEAPGGPACVDGTCAL